MEKTKKTNYILKIFFGFGVRRIYVWKTLIFKVKRNIADK